eukprot:jgi/Psemu1/306911/fgenesh1_kg.289_\
MWISLFILFVDSYCLVLSFHFLSFVCSFVTHRSTPSPSPPSVSDPPPRRLAST